MFTLLINKIQSDILNKPEFFSMIKDLESGSKPASFSGPGGFYLSVFLNEIRNYFGGLILIAPFEREAESFLKDFRLLAPEARLFPDWNVTPYSDTSVESHRLSSRMEALSTLHFSPAPLLLSGLRAALSPLPPPSVLKELSLELKQGSDLKPGLLGKELDRFHYSRVREVKAKGEYARRGEVFDLWPPESEQAFRLVSDFDRLESIRFLNTLTQRSEPLPPPPKDAPGHRPEKPDDAQKLPAAPPSSLRLSAMKEILWSDDDLEMMQRQHRKRFSSDPDPAVRESLVEQKQAEGEQWFYPLCHEEPSWLGDYRPEIPVVFLFRERLEASYNTLVKEYRHFFKKKSEEGKNRPPVEAILRDFKELKIRKILRHQGVRGESEEKISGYETGKLYLGHIDYLKKDLQNYRDRGFEIFIFSEFPEQGERIRCLLKEFPLKIISKNLSRGFILPDSRIAVISENDIFGRKQAVSSSFMKSSARPLESFVDIEPGDFIVHVSHGIGRFKGLKRMRVLGVEKDYIRLEYAKQEMLLLPLEQINMIQRYIGQEGQNPRLDTLGGQNWSARKKKVTKSLEDLAEKLTELYSKRHSAGGYAYPEDSDLQIEFEALFPYEETPGQLKSIREIKQDMEQPRPMDRLLCGDVGYGKTELAMRAAFKAVLGGKQVLFLCPTTILCEQHYKNFRERFKDFPVQIGFLSRFTPLKEQRRYLEELKTGALDILIGTHRLLSKDVRAAHPGLLLIDEEQRFGVKHKEMIKEKRTSIDCLTLSATPIPRTLHMSLASIRDMSVIDTPPAGRIPVETYIEAFSPEHIARAIRKELDRGGQVFYLHNRIDSLISIKNFLEELVPEALVEVASGRTESRRLEDLMHRFTRNDFQILVSTTIIENGIDIPNVNTIIIERADTYGIAQLYQLRGRVGRSGRKAYAYLFYPEKKALTELAAKRLQIISEFTDLGSGFKIAMKDMEVRGAGNLLGQEQSGNILAVGLDMYLRLLSKAVKKIRRQESEEDFETLMELEYQGFLPDHYIPDSVGKMQIYKKIARIQNEQDMEALRQEMTDRFGPVPDEVKEILKVAEIRIVCRRLKVISLQEKASVLKIRFLRVSEIPLNKVMNLIGKEKRIKPDPAHPAQLIFDTKELAFQEKNRLIRESLLALLPDS